MVWTGFVCAGVCVCEVIFVESLLFLHFSMARFLGSPKAALSSDYNAMLSDTFEE